ncbi:TonB-dependent receptor [Mangrovimonas sp. ST2L15]|uniref:SusC/RagA family TonB-linked outer membrane protein n=1 Tax=Mangrovimonas sp. ST2L15 TaxID=1645916 RepID=UPI0009E72B20|nr:TonB-dependent receptor [Mangrovimonas sp. ST2L15]
MNSKILTFTLFLLMSMLSVAQEVNITGTVLDADSDMPLPGVNVIIKNTTKGVATDFDGNFSLEGVPLSSTLVFSYVGFVTKEVQVINSNPITVQLMPDSQSLDEVVIVGYGQQKVTNVSGSISTVKSEALEQLKPVRVEEALQSQATGVNIVSTGSPGAAPAIAIRGIVSNAGSSPLVVIDGIQQSIADLNALNPSDVESMNVLKDAATAAIYGVKGGNGVILVTTKSGNKSGKTTFNFDSSYGIQEVTRTIDVLNASEYAAILNEASSNAGQGLVFDNIGNLGVGTNWQDEVLKDAPIQSHNVSAAGGSDNMTYFISGGYLGQDGVVGGGDKSYFDRITLAERLNIDLSDKFKVLVNNNYANIKGKALAENSITSVLSNALNFDPTLPVYDDNGNYSISDNITQEIVNPLALIDNTYNNNNTNKWFGKLELQYEPIEDLRISSRFSYTYVDVYNKSFSPLVFYGVGHTATNANPDLSPIVTVDPETGEETSTHNRVNESKTTYFTYTYELFGNYDFSINEAHNFQTVAGMSLQRYKGEGLSGSAQDIPFNSWEYADIASATGDLASQQTGSWSDVKRNISYFGRVNYDYKDRYLLSFTGRVDGSTVFGTDNKYGFFPSGSLGWVLSNEEFFDVNGIDFLKLRGSYGNVGNDNISNQFSSISTFPKYTFDGNIIAGSTLGTIPDETVSWESQIQMNAGLDIRLLDNSLSFTGDYYQKTTEDLLFAPVLPPSAGTVTSPPTNIGTSKTNGFDLSLTYNKTVSEDFSINTSLNVTTVNTEVTEVNNDSKRQDGAGYGIPFTVINRFEEGYSPWYFYGYKTDGIFQSQSEIDGHATQNGAQPGDIRFVDVNGDGVIDDLDRTEIGNPFPDFTLGWNLSINYKSFDFNVSTFASVGNDIYRAYERNSAFTNRSARTLDRWTGPGTSNSEPRVTFVDNNNNTRASDRYIEDGSYFRFKNIQLGYTLPKSLYDATGLNNVRIYAQVKNAFTFTKYSGYDPEVTAGSFVDTGIDRGAYPIPRIWMMGINVKF